MTVGVPEINLDTWGLKYVKKKSSTQDIDIGTGSGTPASPKHTGLPESKRPRSEGQQAGAGFESGKPSQNISATNRISDADIKTPESPKQVHGTQGSDKKRQYTHGKEVPVGSDTGIEVSGLGEVGTSKKLTSRGKPSDTKNVQNPDAVAAGREASHESGIQSVQTRTGKDRVGNPVDPEKKGKPTHSALPKAKAEMELAIIKCKLLKMNDISKDDEKYSQGKNINYNSPHSEAGIQSGEIKPHPKPVKGEHTEDTKYTSQAGEELGSGKEGRKRFESDSKKSDEIVEKAIELINEAYGEMNKSNPVIVSEHATGKGKPFCSSCGRDNAKEDAKALEGTDDQQQRMVSGTRGGKAPNCPSCGHRPNKKAGADGGTSTTSSEGGFNHVYSDVHEKKKQESEDEERRQEKESGQNESGGHTVDPDEQ